ncbi:MAG: flagellin N-terminal helical domain-containing protein [Candidatus Thorarchaeota archaeon]
MSLIVNSNIASLNAQRNLGQINSKLSKSIERLSSGLRINNAADDAAGMAIATKLGTQVRGLNQAVRNANNAITLTQTAEGGINTVTNILHRLRELAVQAASDDNTASDRANLSVEGDALTAELTRMVNTTEFNTSKLLDGSFQSKYFQVGANFSQKITFTIGDVRGKSIGGRAEYTADIADGVGNALDANFGQGEVKLNAYGVAATATTDDQYSELDISSQAADGSEFLELSLSMNMNINGTSFTISTVGNGSVGSVADASVTDASMANLVVSAINAASITGVTARVFSSDQYVITAADGVNLEMGVSGLTNAGGTHVSALGLGNNSALVGSIASTLTAYNGESSAIAKAASINAVTTQSGVTATAGANEITGDSAITAVTLASGDVYINGTNIGAVTVTASDGTGALLTAINNQSSTTGVTATTDTDGKLVLNAADGRNISITTEDTTDADALFGSTFTTNYFTDNSALIRSSIQLNDDAGFDITGTLTNLYDGGTTGALNNTNTTDTSKSVAADVATYNVATMSITTQASAEAALLTVDAALDDVNGIRAAIGAVQNRLEFTVANLEIASENTSASQSRILDADFASETAVFTRNQIMVQAATAMLAQANTLPQAALQLLGG